MCEERAHHSASANKRRPSPAPAPFLGGSGWIGDGKIRAVVSQGGTSGFGHLLGKDLPLSPTLLPGGSPGHANGLLCLVIRALPLLGTMRSQAAHPGASTTLPTLASLRRTALSCQSHPESPRSQSKSEAEPPRLELCLRSLHTHLFLCEALEGPGASGLRASGLCLAGQAWHRLVSPWGGSSARGLEDSLKSVCLSRAACLYLRSPPPRLRAGEAGEVAVPCPGRGDMPPD